MDYPIASFAALLDFFGPCFRSEVFGTFKAMVAGWALVPQLASNISSGGKALWFV